MPHSPPTRRATLTVVLGSGTRGSGSVAIVRGKWFSARAIGMHATLLVLVPACAALCDWQVHRALSGNTLSWAYVFEWPFFAGYGTYVWWKLVHDQMEPAAPVVPVGAEGAAAPERIEEPDEELAAYNRYLAQLNASGRAKRW